MEALKKRDFKPVEELVFSDDFMFGAVMRDPEICKGVLERLLQIKIDHIEYPELQKTISPYYTRKGVRLDVYVADSDRVFDVECQSYKVENIGKRTRYYQSMLDCDTLMKGNDYSALKESYIIFICVDDPFDKALPVYTFERICKENAGVDLGDRTHHVIFNASAYESEENSEIKDFLSFVKNNKADSDFTRGIANMVQTKKFEQTFLNEYMAVHLHELDIQRKSRAEGRAEGLAEGRLAAYHELIKSGLLSIKDAAAKLGITEAELQAHL